MFSDIKNLCLIKIRTCVGVIWLISSDARDLSNVVFPALSSPRSRIRSSLSGVDLSLRRIARSPCNNDNRISIWNSKLLKLLNLLTFFFGKSCCAWVANILGKMNNFKIEWNGILVIHDVLFTWRWQIMNVILNRLYTFFIMRCCGSDALVYPKGTQRDRGEWSIAFGCRPNYKFITLELWSKFDTCTLEESPHLHC